MPKADAFCRSAKGELDALLSGGALTPKRRLIYIASHRVEINLLIENDLGQDYPTIQYADDRVMIMHADHSHLIKLKGIFEKFSTSTRLVVNYIKSTMVPINVDITSI